MLLNSRGVGTVIGVTNELYRMISGRTLIGVLARWQIFDVDGMHHYVSIMLPGIKNIIFCGCGDYS